MIEITLKQFGWQVFFVVKGEVHPHFQIIDLLSMGPILFWCMTPFVFHRIMKVKVPILGVMKCSYFGLGSSHNTS